MTNSRRLSSRQVVTDPIEIPQVHLDAPTDFLEGHVVAVNEFASRLRAGKVAQVREPLHADQLDGAEVEELAQLCRGVDRALWLLRQRKARLRAALQSVDTHDVTASREEIR